MYYVASNIYSFYVYEILTEWLAARPMVASSGPIYFLF